MELFETMQKRYSVRAYLPQPVEVEKIHQILEASRWAPTAANRQSHRIVVVQEPAHLKKFHGLCKFRESPLVFIICSQDSEAWVRAHDGFNAGLVDATIVCDHMMLAATDLGLGSLWMSSFDVAGVQREFELPTAWTPQHLLCVGYAAGDSPSLQRFETVRKPLEETIFWETFTRTGK